MRKEMRLPIDAYVAVTVCTDEEGARMLREFSDYVSREVRARRLVITTRREEVGGYVREWEVDGRKIIIGVEAGARGAPSAS